MKKTNVKRARIVVLNLTFKRLIDSSFPGFIEAEFAEANGAIRTLIDKWPVFSSEGDLPAPEAFPMPGKLECELVGTEIDPTGRKIFTICTLIPHGVEDPEGEQLFEVLPAQIEAAKQ